MLTENITLRDGFQIWEGDDSLAPPNDPISLLLDSDTLAESLVFGALPAVIVARRALELLVKGEPAVRASTANQNHDPRLGWTRSDFDPGVAGDIATGAVARWTDEVRARVDSQIESAERRCFTAKSKDGTERTTLYYRRKKIAYTASLRLPAEVHEGHKRSAPCTCETYGPSRALYLSREYGISAYNDHEWDVLSAAFSEYNALNKRAKEQYLRSGTPKAEALADYFTDQKRALMAEEACRSLYHYRGLELEMQLSGSPEIAAPAARTTSDHPENKYGISFPKVEARRWVWDGDRPEPQDVSEIVRFVKVSTEANDAALEQAATWEDYEFNSYRAPVVAGCWLDEGDEGRGYLVHESNQMNDTSQKWFAAQIRAEADRRKKHGDVYHSPHRPLITKRRKDGSTYQVRGHSRFYTLQQQKRARKAAREQQILETLVTAIGREISDPAVQRRIQTLGFEAARAAITAKIDPEILAHFPEARTEVIA